MSKAGWKIRTGTFKALSDAISAACFWSASHRVFEMPEMLYDFV